MKKFVLSLLIALMAIVVANAQQISVVSEGGTDLYRTLQDAIENAPDGSVIYLPGGGFPITNDVKITNKLTIIGIGHKSNNNNVDGVTTISGSLYFNEGSSGSAVMGCYITNFVRIGENNSVVENVVIKYCNLQGVYVANPNCTTIINQCYIRETAYFNKSYANISNSVIKDLSKLYGGYVTNCILSVRMGKGTIYDIYNTVVSNNIFLNKGPEGYHSNYDYGDSHVQVIGNMVQEEWGEDCINIGDTDWNDVFVNYNNGESSPISDYHFKDAYKQYENVVGIYSGSGFNDKQIAPVPFIVAKKVDEQTDASGKLNIKIRVKAGE